MGTLAILSKADKFRRFNHTLNTSMTLKCFNYFVSQELRPMPNTIYVAKRGFSVKHDFHKINVFRQTLNKKKTRPEVHSVRLVCLDRAGFFKSRIS